MFKIAANPTFVAPVDIPVAGGKDHTAKFTFKHRTKDELIEWRKSITGKVDTDLFLEMVEGWDLTEEFSKENVDLLLQHRQGVAWNTYMVYIEELGKHREKN
jgi:hypothetical protein